MASSDDRARGAGASVPASGAATSATSLGKTCGAETCGAGATVFASGMGALLTAQQELSAGADTEAAGVSAAISGQCGWGMQSAGRLASVAHNDMGTGPNKASARINRKVLPPLSIAPDCSTKFAIPSLSANRKLCNSLTRLALHGHVATAVFFNAPRGSRLGQRECL